KLGIVGNVINVLVFIVKGWLLVFVMMWVRWTLPRLRIDQVMMTCIKYLLPISCVLLIGVCFWQLLAAQVPFVGAIVKVLLSVGSFGLLAWMIVEAVRTPSRMPVGALGAWDLTAREYQPAIKFKL
ncbi:MAG TPA: NADH-quinone oxidoreductase subunit H, partial [Gemmataceae bacterium]|nr:NADH-quinone oxidoreductase subunit H [Gemmataceae bacterium]